MTGVSAVPTRSAKPPRVCFVSHSGGAGGAERALVDTIDSLQGRGVSCSALLPWSGWLSGQLEVRRVPHAVVPFTWWMGQGTPWWKRAAKLGLNLAVLPALLWHMRRWRSELVYSNSLTICVGAWAAGLLRLPHIWHAHEFGEAHHGLRMELDDRLGNLVLNRLSTVFVVPSRALAASLARRVPERKIRVVAPVVSPPSAAPRSVPTGDAFRCIVVGTLQPGKAHADAIRATARLANRGCPVELVIVGDGPVSARREMQALADGARISDRVTFTGAVPSVYPEMTRAHVVVVCSRHEAFGRVTVEGMLANRPVVGARSGATAELIRDTRNGLLYEPGDTEMLADCLQSLWEHPEQANRLAAVGHRWARHCFSGARAGVQLERLFHATCQSI